MVVALVVDALVAKRLVKMLCREKVFWVVVEKAVVKTPVPLLYARGYTAESEEDDILLLKSVKSAEAR